MKSIFFLFLFCLIFSFSFSLRTTPLVPTPSTSNLLKQLDRPIVIGTRGSMLALAQAHETKRRLENKFPELKENNAIEIKKIMTKGDAILNQPLAEIGGKGLFTKELDVALLDGTVDLCVHSMKDVPTWLPSSTSLLSMLPREDPRDVFISEKYKSLDDLPNNSLIGSASLRRQAQLLSKNKSFKVVNFRGNVQTRLKKLNEGIVDGTLLALAGLKRLGMNDLINSNKAEILSIDKMLPAISQGAIGIQVRIEKNDLNQGLLGSIGVLSGESSINSSSTKSRDLLIASLVQQLDHAPTRFCVEIERQFLRELDGNCRTPIAGYSWITNKNTNEQLYNNDSESLSEINLLENKNNLEIHFQGLLSKPDGSKPLKIYKKSNLDDTPILGTICGKEIKQMAGNMFKEYQQDYSQAVGWANLSS